MLRQRCRAPSFTEPASGRPLHTPSHSVARLQCASETCGSCWPGQVLPFALLAPCPPAPACSTGGCAPCCSLQRGPVNAATVAAPPTEPAPPAERRPPTPAPSAAVWADQPEACRRRCCAAWAASCGCPCWGPAKAMISCRLQATTCRCLPQRWGHWRGLLGELRSGKPFSTSSTSLWWVLAGVQVRVPSSTRPCWLSRHGAAPCRVGPHTTTTRYWTPHHHHRHSAAAGPGPADHAVCGGEGRVGHAGRAARHRAAVWAERPPHLRRVRSDASWRAEDVPRARPRRRRHPWHPNRLCLLLAGCAGGAGCCLQLWARQRSRYCPAQLLCAACLRAAPTPPRHPPSQSSLAQL